MRQLFFIGLLLMFYSCKNDDKTSELPWNNESYQAPQAKTEIAYSDRTLDLMGIVTDENNDTINDCIIYVLSPTDSASYPFINRTSFFVPLPLGDLYKVCFEKEGYIRKHFLVDLVNTGSLEDSKFGFEFPLELNLVPGDVNLPSKLVGHLEYIDSIGDIDNVLIK